MVAAHARRDVVAKSVYMNAEVFLHKMWRHYLLSRSYQNTLYSLSLSQLGETAFAALAGYIFAVQELQPAIAGWCVPDSLIQDRAKSLEYIKGFESSVEILRGAARAIRFMEIMLQSVLVVLFSLVR